jgi:hypothetical protein
VAFRQSIIANNLLQMIQTTLQEEFDFLQEIYLKDIALIFQNLKNLWY